MNYSDLIIFIMEMIGTVAFAASGAMLVMHMYVFEELLQKEKRSFNSG